MDRQYCDNTHELQAGLCYTKAKDDFNFLVTGCHKDKKLSMSSRIGPVHTRREGYVKK